jgi:hypothetical protein
VGSTPTSGSIPVDRRPILFFPQKKTPHYHLCFLFFCRGTHVGSVCQMGTKPSMSGRLGDLKQLASTEHRLMVSQGSFDRPFAKTRRTAEPVFCRYFFPIFCTCSLHVVPPPGYSGGEPPSNQDMFDHSIIYYLTHCTKLRIP